MTLHLITSHLVAFALLEVIATTILVLALRSYKTEQPNSKERNESEDLIGVMVLSQLFGIMVMALDMLRPSLVHFMFSSGLLGIVIFGPLILLSAFLSARIITPRILRN